MAVKKTDVVEIKPFETQDVRIRLVGDTPLIEHKWGDKAKRMMLGAHRGSYSSKIG